MGLRAVLDGIRAEAWVLKALNRGCFIDTHRSGNYIGPLVETGQEYLTGACGATSDLSWVEVIQMQGS